MKVIHFVRKSSQLKASFIQNQVVNHIAYTPGIVYKIKTDQGGGFSTFHNTGFKTLDLSGAGNFWGKIKFKLVKLITTREARKIREFVNDADILHFHYGTDAGIYLPLLRHIAKPKVVSFYGYDCSSFPQRLGGYGKYYLKQRVFKHADVVLAMSEDMKKDLLKLGCPEEKIKIHYHGIPLAKFYGRHNYDPSGKHVSYLIISSLTPKKGHLFLLEAFKKAQSINPAIQLTIVGSGLQWHDIMRFIKLNNMQRYVSVFGKIAYASQQHLTYLKQADVFIHPSIVHKNADKEGIPGAIVEAMAAGLPVISTFHAGIPYIIETGKTGLLVHENDVDALCQAILKTANDPGLRKNLGRQGQQYAMEHLDVSKKEQLLEAIYNGFQ
ncbi:glycosyltransferase family 4 protein [Pedobacter sp. BS3]|uniref:glycosyltransferase family 4 protein n=1 Tax=Pedobacter sp. BS3 TaxID=2567937 RepID=UPI00165A11BF|nr:glycosyltransferase family 4 protein [Pedobacter sp. BS3]